MTTGTTEKKRAMRKPNQDLDAGKRVGAAITAVKLRTARVEAARERLHVEEEALEVDRMELDEARLQLEAIAKTATS